MSYHRSSVHSNGYSPDGHSGREREEAPTYLMEHLATFTVSKETGIVYPADGMRRLLQLEKTNGIWSQKMQLRLDDNMVLIIDNETGDVMEKFPAALIQEPTAFTSHDPIEIYNNILVFIVGDERQPNSHSEMHIFQCQMISAQELVKDLKQLRAGKSPGPRGNQIPPPPPTPPPEPPLNGVSVKEQVNAFNLVSQGDGRGSSDVVGASHDDESSSTSSEKYGRDVTTLNHCFDDIEKFIARLQNSAAASRELERRKKNRKSKKKDMGDGLLIMRAKPPPEPEFIDIFQKFKLSFILLAKLKHHIHDPNAPELVHFLFTPLALIVDASHDNKYTPNLPAKVISPLLTQEAINLLMNCVTSKETELWHSLGDPWLIPREKWKGKVPPYHPVFMDGWSPDYPVTEDIDDRRDLTLPLGNSGSINKGMRDDEQFRSHESEIRDSHYPRERDREREDPHYISDYGDYPQAPSPTDPARYQYERNYTPRNDRYMRDERLDSQSPGDSEPGPPPPPRSDISADSIERSGLNLGVSEKFERAQARWLEELRNTGSKIVQVTYPRTANNDKELSVIRGEFLQVLDDSRKWWKARNCRGEVAHVPHTIVTPYQPTDQDVLRENSRGYYPSQDRVGRPGSGGIPAPPPAPPNLVQPAPADWVRKERLERGDSRTPLTNGTRSSTSTISNDSRTKERMVVELKDTLSQLQIKRPILSKKKATLEIDIDSTPSQVKAWITERGFNERICKLVEGMDGKHIFDLSLERCCSCGIPDGKRLFNQILLQRHRVKYQTTRSAELAQKLAIARQKSEMNQKGADE